MVDVANKREWALQSVDHMRVIEAKNGPTNMHPQGRTKDYLKRGL